eukprot:GHVQ01028465.1.p1 GENE.GHVQ01028465.1~~GHVQ01028465.1.p1  ORF type:complete len:164 (-),score=21.09 GHVQ01028465.1:125-565(-)
MAVVDVFKFLLELGMIVGPSLGYAFQYVEIQETCEPDGFSSFVVLVLVVSNTLRIVWWYGERFEHALLSQAVLLLFIQFLLLELATRLRRTASAPSSCNALPSSSIPSTNNTPLRLLPQHSQHVGHCTHTAHIACQTDIQQPRGMR